MAENTKNVEFKNPHPELPVREPILKLGKMVTDRAAIKLGLEKLTADDPEYWGLDFGTATTCDYVDESGAFQGGITAPGIRISAKALWEDAAKLPEIEAIPLR